jgi:hypothetical protein
MAVPAHFHVVVHQERMRDSLWGYARVHTRAKWPHRAFTTLRTPTL